MEKIKHIIKIIYLLLRILWFLFKLLVFCPVIIIIGDVWAGTHGVIAALIVCTVMILIMIHMDFAPELGRGPKEQSHEDQAAAGRRQDKAAAPAERTRRGSAAASASIAGRTRERGGRAGSAFGAGSASSSKAGSGAGSGAAAAAAAGDDIVIREIRGSAGAGSRTSSSARQRRLDNLQDETFIERFNAEHGIKMLSGADLLRLRQIREFLRSHSIERLYHFTDLENFYSIISHNGLYSWYACQRRQISISRPGGDSASRRLDLAHQLENKVRLSFCQAHPMLFAARSDGRISDPVILEIDAAVALLQTTLFSDCNAAKNECRLGNTAEFLAQIPFEIFKQKYYAVAADDKKFYQAEILVEEYLPFSDIKAAYRYDTKESLL